MKNLFKSILVINFLAMYLLGSFVYADSKSNLNSSLNSQAMQLAMLNYSQLVSTKNARLKKQLPNVKKKQAYYPSNCMTWNVGQINRKSSQFNKTISKYSKQYRIDSNLIKAVITAESCFKTKALSSAGAQGLMQLIPATAERFGVKNSYDSKQNIRGGVKYLRFLHDRFKGDLKKIIAAYNAGEGAVDRYKGIPPYKETKQYVKNVLHTYEKLRAPLLRKLSLRKQAAANLTKRKLAKSNTVHHVSQPPRLGLKPGRSGWRYNRARAPHLYKH